MEQRPQGKGRLIPAQAFEHERNFLLALPPHLPAPYQIHERSVDQYGYVAFDANYYWAPEELHGEITVLEYDRHLVLCQGHRRLLEYSLALDGVRGQEFLLRTPMRRFGQLEELVGAAVYLASDAASFVTGQLLVVDGGFLASGVNQ